MVDQNGEYYK